MCVSLPKGPFEVILVIGISIVAAPIHAVGAVASKTKDAFSNVDQKMINVYNFFNPTIFEDRIKTWTYNIETFNKMRSDETVSKWHVLRGNYYLLQNVEKNAVEDFLRAVQLDVYNVDAHYMLGVVNMAHGAFDKARSNFEQALTGMDHVTLVPAYKQTFHNLESSWNNLTTGFLHHVRDSVTKVTNKVQLNEATRLHVDQQLAQNDVFYQKIQAMESQQSVTKSAILNAKALCSYYVADYTTALQVFEQLLNSLEQDAALQTMACYWCNIGNVHFYMLNFTKCITYLNMVLEKQAQLPQKWIGSVYGLRSAAYHFTKQADKCASDLSEAKKRGKNQPLLWRMLPKEMLVHIFIFVPKVNRDLIGKATNMFDSELKLVNFTNKWK